MVRITDTFTEFLVAIEEKKPVACKKNGFWRIRSKLEMFFRKLFIKREDDSLLKAYLEIMEKAECKDLFFHNDPAAQIKQRQFYKKIIDGVYKVTQVNKTSKNPAVQNLISKVEMAAIQLKYLIQSENGGIDRCSKETIDENLFKVLSEKVRDWQLLDEKYQYTEKVDFTPKLRKMCKYPELINFLLKDSNQELLHSYFQTALRDNVSVKILSEYHFESEKLNKNFLARRVFSLSNKNILKIDMEELKAGSTQKKLNLLMDGVKVNILNKEKKFEFSSGLKMNVRKIYKDFENKNNDPGLLEVFFYGIKAFNSHDLAPKLKNKKYTKKSLPVKIDTTTTNWYENLPTLDIRSKEYIEKRYRVNVKPGDWVAVLEATRREELDIDKAHGYSVFYQPLSNGTYRVYSFGAFPNEFPQNTLELINFIGKTVPGTIAHDPNYYYSQSQKASCAFAVPENVGKSLLEEIGNKKNQGIAFQFGWENCAFTIRNIFLKVFKDQQYEVTVPEFFQKKFVHSRPAGALKVVQSMLDNSSKKIVYIAKLILALIFGATRSYTTVEEDGNVVKKSLWNTPFFEDAKINLPSAMHYRIKKDRKKKAFDTDYQEKYSHCVLNYGHS